MSILAVKNVLVHHVVVFSLVAFIAPSEDLGVASLELGNVTTCTQLNTILEHRYRLSLMPKPSVNFVRCKKQGMKISARSISSSSVSFP